MFIVLKQHQEALFQVQAQNDRELLFGCTSAAMSSLHRSVYQCSNCCCIQFCYQCCIMDHPEMQSITNASKRCVSCRRTVTIRLRNYKMPATTYNAKLFHTLHICRHRLDFFMLLQGWEPCKYWKIGKISLIRTLISVIIYIFLGSGGGGTFSLF